MRLMLIAFTERGGRLALSLAQSFTSAGDRAQVSLPRRFAQGLGTAEYESLDGWTASAVHEADGLIFVGACGIAVRAIAPHVEDKFSDPAVVAVDEGGGWAVPLLSGHVGGANDLARRVAALTGGQAAISTATDVGGVFAADQWAARQGLFLDGRTAAKHISAALLAGEQVGFACDFTLRGDLPIGVLSGPRKLGIAITAHRRPRPFEETLRLVPRVLRLGVGCRRGTSAEAIAATVERALEGAELYPEAVAAVCTIDLKEDEPGLLSFCADRGWPLICYTAAELGAVVGDFTPSEFVSQITGVDNVCERAAALGGRRLLVQKKVGEGVTVAVAIEDFAVSFEEDVR